MKVLEGISSICKATIGTANAFVASSVGTASFEVVGNSFVDKVFDKVDEIKPIYRKKGLSVYQDKRNGSSVKLKGVAKKAAKVRIKAGK